MPRKVCKGCLVSKKVTDFHKHPANPGGRQRLCKQCHYKANAEWMKLNRPTLRPKLLAYSKQYYATHKSEIKVKARAYYERRYDLFYAKMGVYRAKVLQAYPIWADHVKIKAVYRRAAKLRKRGFDMHVDHVIPLQGKLVCGLHVHNNLRIISATKNREKRNKYMAGR